MMLLELVREMTPRDRRFVVPTWARSARYGMSIPDQFRIVDRVLESARVLVIASDEITVHAWLSMSCHRLDDRILHYLYVAPELRRQGLARGLLALAFGDQGPLLTTHEIPYRLAPRARLNPYLLAVS